MEAEINFKSRITWEAGNTLSDGQEEPFTHVEKSWVSKTGFLLCMWLFFILRLQNCAAADDEFLWE